jgi:hypothetical protein
MAAPFRKVTEVTAGPVQRRGVTRVEVWVTLACGHEKQWVLGPNESPFAVRAGQPFPCEACERAARVH